MSARRADLVGLVPAGGRGDRVAPLPMSKELYPVGFRTVPGRRGPRAMVAAHCLLDSMREAGVDRAFVVLRKGKWDIPAYLGDGAELGMRLAYLAPDQTPGVPYTVDTAYPYLRSVRVAFGFPDIVHEPRSAIERLVGHLEQSAAEVVLGLFPVDRCEKMDMVELDEQGRARSVVVKPSRTTLRYTWILAVWTAAFTEFLHEFVGASRQSPAERGDVETRELFMGDAFQAALDTGMAVHAVRFDGGRYLDIGTPEDLVEAARWAENTLKEGA